MGSIVKYLICISGCYLCYFYYFNCISSLFYCVDLFILYGVGYFTGFEIFIHFSGEGVVLIILFISLGAGYFLIGLFFPLALLESLFNFILWAGIYLTGFGFLILIRWVGVILIFVLLYSSVCFILLLLFYGFCFMYSLFVWWGSCFFIFMFQIFISAV